MLTFCFSDGSDDERMFLSEFRILQPHTPCAHCHTMPHTSVARGGEEVRAEQGTRC